MSLRIAMWSGPRNISTAMMRAWENRADTAVVDEPFYAYYLQQTGAPHPGREEVLASQPTDWREVVEALSGPIPGGHAIWYQKHMAQHYLPGMQGSWLGELTHCFLIRNPDEVVASFTANRPDAAPWELGFRQQVELFDYMQSHSGEVPPVLDAQDVLMDPHGALRALCERLDIPFDDQMLSWPAGSRETDGVWAKHWYRAVEASTGFRPYRPREIRLDARQQALAAQCWPSYRHLAAHCLVP